MIEKENTEINVKRQCELVGLNRSTFYYEKKSESAYNLLLMRLLDEQYTKTPFYGIRKLTAQLKVQGHAVNKKRVRRLLKLMGLETIYRKPKFKYTDGKENKVFPYLLEGLEINRPDHVWATDITYIRMPGGWLYLACVMDWFSRYVLSWEISNTMDTIFVIRMLKNALRKSKPEIFNSDQGTQFTSIDFINVLKNNGITISMVGKGRCWDNIFVERLWRSVKYEEVYLKDYSSFIEAKENLEKYFDFYNNERLHQNLGYKTPYEIYYGKTKQNFDASVSLDENRKIEISDKLILC